MSCACSVMSDSLHPHGLQFTRLLCPWNFPGRNTGVGCHCLLQGIFLPQGSTLRLCCLLHWQAGSLPMCRLKEVHDGCSTHHFLLLNPAVHWFPFGRRWMTAALIGAAAREPGLWPQGGAGRSGRPVRRSQCASGLEALLWSFGVSILGPSVVESKVLAGC